MEKSWPQHKVVLRMRCRVQGDGSHMIYATSVICIFSVFFNYALYIIVHLRSVTVDFQLCLCVYVFEAFLFLRSGK